MANAELNGYELSRNWFDWCFENPELVKPIHTALYFFIIEHCNRLGWKDKFGLPSGMTMDAIGVKNYKTYSKAFLELSAWGFINIIQKSKNQYSSCIIAIVKNTKANTKALSKASLKHSLKQVQSIVVIDKQELLTKEPITIKADGVIKTWRNDFEIYKEEVRNAYKSISKDKDWIKQQEEFNPNLDILLSLKKSCVNYWATEGGWANKKKSKTKDIDWKATFANNIDKSKVYKPKQNETAPTTAAPYHRPIKFTEG